MDCVLLAQYFIESLIEKIMEINTKYPVHVAKYIKQSMEFGKCCHTP
jgi:hypothetical protein